MSDNKSIIMSKAVIAIIENRLKSTGKLTERNLDKAKNAFVKAQYINNDLEYCLATAISVNDKNIILVAGKNLDISCLNSTLIARAAIEQGIKDLIIFDNIKPSELYIDSKKNAVKFEF